MAILKNDVFTHDELVRRAGRWLRGTKKCGVVLLERRGTSSEIPDAIGWANHCSTLVECKTSRSDFKADKLKVHHRLGGGVGQYRYYLTPPGLLSKNDLPEGWGLLECHDRFVRVKSDAIPRCDYDKHFEIGMLVKAIRDFRVGAIIAPFSDDELEGDQ